jgi:signal transduction histidine kinase/ligand-binding sensor domain-containing protein/CheY-like chemotaxis protein
VEPEILWIGTQGGGLNRFDVQREIFTHYRHTPGNPDSLASDTIFKVIEDRNGILWISTSESGLDKFDRKTGKFTHYRHDKNDPHSLSSDYVYCVYEDREGRLWIGTDGGVNRFDPVNNRFIRYAHHPNKPGSLSNNRVRTIVQDSLGILWVGTLNGGLNRWNEDTGEFYHYRTNPLNPCGLSDDDVYAIYEDKFNIIWIGTEGGGVNKLDLKAKHFGHYRVNSFASTALSHNDIWAIYESRWKPGHIWIGTKGGGINLYDRKNDTFSHYRYIPGNPNSLSTDSIYALCEDRAGNLWIGTDGFGINRMDIETGTVIRFADDPTKPDGLKDTDVWVIKEDRDGNIWIGTIIQGLYKFDLETNRFTRFQNDPDNPKSLSSNDIWSIYQDSGGVIWVGTADGLNRLDEQTGTFTRFANRKDDPESLNNSRILSIYEDRAGIFWIGTLGGGLNQMHRETGTFIHYTEENGLPNNSIYGILEQNPLPGNATYYLWLSSNSGLARFDPLNEEFETYNKRDGLQGNEFNAGAYCKMKNGQLYFGGINGFNVFNPGDIENNPHRPRVMITNFQLFNEDVKPGQEINGRVLLEHTITETSKLELYHRENVISFEFAALHYSSPSENQYAYRMDGIENDWNEVGNRRFVTYNRLPPGKYTFRVKASNNDGKWDEDGASIKIIIAQPFWTTGWFYGLCIIAAIAVALGFHRLRVRRLKNQEKRLTLLVKERTGELEKITDTVRSINQELKKAKEKAEQERQTAEIANRYKSDFLARMSHEIRTPMNSIIGFAELVLDTRLNDEQSDFLKAIKQSGEALLSIINEILDLSKIESGQFTLEAIEFDPGTVASRVRKLVAPRLREKTIKLYLRVSDDVPTRLLGDSGRFRQVLTNLTENAIKFTREGEVQLSITVDEETQDRVKLHTTVKDTGIGIPEDKKELIFEAFQQADVTDTRSYEGTGLGLAICRRIARLMDGDIRVESELGKGSTFHFTAWMQKAEPLLTEKSDKDSAAAESAVARQALIDEGAPAIRILMAEDNHLNRKLARFLLSRAGYRLDTVNTGKEVVEKFLASPELFDMILMDIQMPEMNGKDAARIIRQKGFTQVPIIAMTAASMKGDREKCLEAGMNDYISKPIKRDILYRVIKKWTPRGNFNPAENLADS